MKAETLRYLSAHSKLRGMPSLLSCAAIGSSRLMLQTPGNGSSGPRTFGTLHHDLLSRVYEATCGVGRFDRSEMWNKLIPASEALIPTAPAIWRERISRARDLVRSRLGPQEIPLSLAHRDFGPWNTQVTRAGHLFAFDWETAQVEAVPLYDTFDFHLRAAVLFGWSEEPVAFTNRILGSASRWWPQFDSDASPDYLLCYLLDRAVTRLRYALWIDNVAADAMLQLIGSMLDAANAWIPASPPCSVESNER